jgi:NADH-quinone oxidoreductase subunit I
MVYEKEDLTIDGEGKYHGYNFYREAGLAIKGKEKGEGDNENPPIDIKSLIP